MRPEIGLLRSILVYYGNPLKLRRMRRFYAQFIRPGDLCFDVGAHVGNRLLVWTQLGARVIGIEPQPLCLALLQRWYGSNPRVTLVEEAVGATPGTQTLWVSGATPTVTTLSTEWIAAVQQADSFAGLSWDGAVTVGVTTLDELIACHGVPAFCKIDVEGYELEVLRGLSHPLPALSFEYVPAAQDMAVGCVERLEHLGDYEFNWSVGEQHRWQRAEWQNPGCTRGFLARLAMDDRSGDIYARLRSGNP